MLDSTALAASRIFCLGVKAIFVVLRALWHSQLFFEIPPGVTLRAGGHFARGAAHDYIAAFVSAFRAKVDDVVCTFDDIHVVLYDDERVPAQDERVKGGQQPFDVVEVQAGRGLVEDEDGGVGLFHAGPEGNRLDNVVENASADVAQKVPGFDVVFMGHDHARHCRKIVNVAGDSVLIVDPANRAGFVSDVTIRVSKKDGKVLRKSVEGTLTNVRDYPADEAFVRKFQPQYQSTIDFVSRKIGRINQTISTKDAYFGPSAFIDLIHQLQLDISGADISFCAPLSFNAEIREGDIYMSDMFNLYKYENMLYVMQLSGQEIKDFLEMSYAIWTNQMKSADDHILLLNEEDKGFGRFKNPSFNFDSAAGIIYTVDVTKPQGEKIRIESMADGTPFSLQKIYKVAVNSYRGNGGGDLLTKGAGIPKSELSKRIVFSTDKDLRYYLMKRIEEVKTLDPKPLNQWRFVPEEWTRPAIERDYQLLFGNK